MMTLKEFKKKYRHIKSSKFLGHLKVAEELEADRVVLTKEINSLNRCRATLEDKLSKRIDKLYLELEKLGEYKF